jgi:tRNA A-37 threonylcarbamoyl transferase component Bud32
MLELPPRLAGRFVVLDKLGQGAIAEVLRARDEQTPFGTVTEVALKILYPALRDSAVVVERFRREVDFVRQIRDPHVLTIHDVVDSDGFLFLVMAYHPGGDLADRIARQGPLPVDDLTALAAQLCAGLEAAHKAGVVHRDVKPSNVLCGAGPGLDVRLCDFGLARSAEGAGITTSAAVLGTPEYMAPEVIAEGHADPRSDIYSLGVVLFEAATGRLPFAADSPYQLMRLHLEGEAPRARLLAPQLPRAMDAAIARALAKDPLDRFASAAQLADAFTACAPPPVALTFAALVPAATTARVCPACGGWVVESLRICADCGHATLTVEYAARDGEAVLVTGPGKPGDKIEAQAHVRLHRLLEELPLHAHDRAQLPARAPRFPFYVARGLTHDSASGLLARVLALGLVARIETGWMFAPPEMRSKIGKLGGRLTAAAGLGYWYFNLLQNVFRHMHWSWTSLVIWACAGVAVPMTLGLARGVRSARPLLARPKSGGDDGLPQALALAVARLGNRQDRRLLGRICDRLHGLARTAAAGEAAALTRYAAELAHGLHMIEAAHQASAQADEAAGAAQTALRKLERGAVVVRTRLLRILTELDALATAELAGQGAVAREHLQTVRLLSQDWAFEVEAERELAALLAPVPGARG